MTHSDQIDVLLATYNGGAFLSEQIDSILNQTHRQLRLIIRDDGSQDHTKALLEEYAKKFPSKIKLFPFDRNLGTTANFSSLMAQASASYIMFSDQDDVWNRDKIEITLNKIKQLENRYSTNHPLLVHTDLAVANDQLELISPSFWKYSRLNPSYGYALNRLLVQNVVTGCTIMINSPLLKLVTPLPKEAVLHDWWIALVASARGKIDSLPSQTMLYRQHKKNVLGATKFWSIKHFIHQLKTFFSPENHKTSQATALLLHHGFYLSPDHKKTVSAFLELSKSSWFKRRLLILKHRFFYSDMLRNLVNVLLKPHP